ncbi:hypothetical protein Dsin_005373 [Dipteronia sinensis]|uniref:Uncharacterized protein n=1 Tax=Dipteronia sinensis TaxID=43782 RepID=A0AAE0AWC7_9ROSI|nr:hypothetical protein Dsin_005373 [Dipteronia sinensis]
MANKATKRWTSSNQVLTEIACTRSSNQLLQMARSKRSVYATESENRMGEEIDLLVKVSEHFPTKINSTSSTVAIKQITEKLTEVQLALFRTTCFRKLLVFKSLAI